MQVRKYVALHVDSESGRKCRKFAHSNTTKPAPAARNSRPAAPISAGSTTAAVRGADFPGRKQPQQQTTTSADSDAASLRQAKAQQAKPAHQIQRTQI